MTFACVSLSDKYRSGHCNITAKAMLMTVRQKRAVSVSGADLSTKCPHHETVTLYKTVN